MKVVDTKVIGNHTYQLIHMEASDTVWPNYIMATYVRHSTAPTLDGFLVLRSVDPGDLNKKPVHQSHTFDPYHDERGSAGVCLVRGAELPTHNEWGEIAP